MADNQSGILYERTGGYAVITLNRPEKFNSFTGAMHEAMRDALVRIRADADVRAVLITGNGRGFCAGQDLSERNMAPGAAPPDLGKTIGENYNPLVRALRDLTMPVVCAVNGVAAGAGANIALACDIVIAARSASFIQAFCKIGLIPDSGGTWFLPRLVGTARARGLALLGDKLSAEQAEQWGLIWRCVDDAELMPEARRICEQIANGPALGLATIKQALRAAEHNTLDQQLDLELTLQRELGVSHDYREGVRAFIEKRPPKFTGK